jgi:hypothetical protein
MTISRLDLIQLPGPAYIDQISNLSQNMNVEEEDGYGSANVHPLLSAISGQTPTIEFTTSQLASLLASVPFVGSGIVASSAFFWKATSQTGNVARATATHQKTTMTLGYIHWNQIQLNHDSSGSADVMVTVGYDGTNEPLVPAGSTALPSAITDTERFVQGPVYINGAQLGAGTIQSSTITSGIELEIIGGDGIVWATLIALKITKPVITVVTTEVSPLITTGVDGVALNGTTGIVVYGRKMTTNQAGGVARVANLTAQHLSFTGLNGKYHVETAAAEGNTPALTTIRAPLTALNDATLPLVIATNAVIP